MVGEPANPLREVLEECRIGIVLLTVFSLFTNLLILTSPIYMMQVCDPCCRAAGWRRWCC